MVARVHRAAFGRETEGRLAELLGAAGKQTVSLVAEIEAQVVGHVMFSRVVVERAAAEIRVMGLAPLAVLPEFQRRGIGMGLVGEGLAVCGRMGVHAVVVLGNPHYYSRFGFMRASGHGLKNEYGADEDFMVVELRPGTLARIGGMVRYGEEFREVGC